MWSRMYSTDLRTFWHWAIQVGQEVSSGWAKKFEKIRIFDHFENLRPYISATVINRGIQAAYWKIPYPTVACVWTHRPRVVQKVSDIIPVLAIMSRLPFLFSWASSSWPRGFYKVGQKIRIFDHLQTLRISATVKKRHTSSVGLCSFFLCPVKKLCEIRMASLCQFYWRIYCIVFISSS